MKLSDRHVADILNAVRWRREVTNKKLANKYGVSVGTIERVIRDEDIRTGTYAPKSLRRGTNLAGKTILT